MHVVVTGASSGIGRDLAKAFAADGAQLSLVARRKPLLEELQRELGGQSSKTVAIDADLGVDSLDWLARAEAAFGPIDVLVNNAGVSYVEPAAGVDAARARALYQVNVHTPIAAARKVLPAMLERRSGTIVNVTSIAAFTAVPFFSDYNASKAALAQFSESLRAEVARAGVHVLTVYPGPIATPMAERNYGQFSNPRLARAVPTGDTATLAKLVQRAIAARQPRVIYPQFYRLAWWFPNVARWISQRGVSVTGAKTPEA